MLKQDIKKNPILFMLSMILNTAYLYLCLGLYVYVESVILSNET